MPKAPATRMAEPSTKGDSTPNHEVPDAEFAGYQRLSNDAISTQVRMAAPASGNTSNISTLFQLSNR